jgi:hypothetical protein
MHSALISSRAFPTTRVLDCPSRLVIPVIMHPRFGLTVTFSRSLPQDPRSHGKAVQPSIGWRWPILRSMQVPVRLSSRRNCSSPCGPRQPVRVEDPCIWEAQALRQTHWKFSTQMHPATLLLRTLVFLVPERLQRKPSLKSGTKDLQTILEDSLPLPCANSTCT